MTADLHHAHDIAILIAEKLHDPRITAHFVEG